MLPIDRAILATASFQGSAVGPLELMESPILQALQNMGELPDGEPVTVESGDFTATLTLSGENYQGGSSGLIFTQEEGQPGSCHFTFGWRKRDNDLGRGKGLSPFLSGDTTQMLPLGGREGSLGWAGSDGQCRRAE